MIIELGEWLPDIQAIDNPGLIEGTHTLRPTAAGYTSFYAANDLSNASAGTAPILGGISCKAGGLYRDYYGTANDLYRLTWDGGNLVPDNASSTPATYAVPSGNYWDFTQFGDDVYAVNGGTSGADTMQTVDVNSGSANFASVSAGQPKALTITTCREFVVVGNTYDATDGVKKTRVRWSSYGDAKSASAWTVSASTQADFQDLSSSVGSVQRVLGGANCFVVTESSVFLMTYEGPPTVFRFDEIVPGLGTNYPHSAVRDGNYIYFWAHAGPVRVGADGSVKWIARGKCEHYLNNLTRQSSDTVAIGFIDRENNAVGWCIGDQSSPASDTTYYYFPDYDRWMPVFMGTTVKGNYPWTSQLIFPAGSNSVGNEIDSLIWHGGTDPIGNNDNFLWTRSVPGVSGGADGSYDQWKAVTGAMTIVPGKRSLITEVRTVADYRDAAASETVSVAAINDPGKEPVPDWTYTAFSKNAAADTHQGFSEGRYHSFCVESTAISTYGRANIRALDIPDAAISQTGRY